MKGTTVKATAGLVASGGTQIKAEAEAKLLSTRTSSKAKDKTTVTKKAKAKASVDEFVSSVDSDVNDTTEETDTKAEAASSVGTSEAKTLPLKEETKEAPLALKTEESTESKEAKKTEAPLKAEKIKKDESEKLKLEDLKLDKKIQEPLEKTSRALSKLNARKVRALSDTALPTLTLLVPIFGIPLMAMDNKLNASDVKNFRYFMKNLNILRLAINSIMDGKSTTAIADKFIEEKTKSVNELIDSKYKNADLESLRQDAAVYIEESFVQEKTVLQKQLGSSSSLKEMTTIATKIVVIEKITHKIEHSSFTRVSSTNDLKTKLAKKLDNLFTTHEEQGRKGSDSVSGATTDAVIASLLSKKKESLADKFMEVKDLKVRGGFVDFVKSTVHKVKTRFVKIFSNLNPQAKAKVTSLGSKFANVIEYDDLARAAHKSSKGITKAIETLRDPENRKELKYDIFNAAALVSDSLEKQADKVLAKEA